MTLSTKIATALATMLCLATAGSLAFVWAIDQAGQVLESTVADNVASVRAAEELEIALLEQKGLVANYMLDDGDTEWLEKLAAREPSFGHWLAVARSTAKTAAERALIETLTSVYADFNRRRDETLALFQDGQRSAARQMLLGEVQDLYRRAYDLCEEYLVANERAIDARSAAAARRTDRLRWLALAQLSLICLVGGALGVYVFRGILTPLKRLATEAGGERTGNAVHEVGERMHSLMSDITETRGHLERSRQQLLSSEKLASVGKLAASVAHEIRNPLTSMKMRLHYLRGELGADPRYEEDLRVVSEEVARLEGVVRSFLEFSRPPDLRAQLHDADELVERTLELCRHRLDGSDIDVVHEAGQGLPPVWVDAEQTRQVFLNLILNASEAMLGGGRLTLRTRAVGPLVSIDFEDTGPGIPDDVRPRVFEPFYSTKEQGTGLGLAIAARIVERQGGDLVLAATSPRGTVFRVDLPTSPTAHADDPGR